MFRRVLLAYDGSEPARKAFECCLQLVTSFRCEIIILAVIRQSEFSVDVDAPRMLERVEQDFDRQLASLRRRARTAGVEPEALIRVGDPCEQIILAADEWRADLIVTGGCGRGRFARLFSGSVSKRLVASAPCAVLVIQ